MGKSQIRRRKRLSQNGWPLPALSGFLLACSAQPSAAPVPAWPKEPAPEYPDMPPAPASAPVPGPASGPGKQGVRAESSSPLATKYRSHAAVQELDGKATYYADSLSGNKTASGEVYRPKLFTAAHKTLPFGSVARVTRTDTQRVTYVRINDRGPFGNRDRIIDLSKAAAKDLEMLRAGVVPVRVEVLELPRER